MKAPSSLICTSAVIATIASSLAAFTTARPMHAGIDYHRYLQVKDDIQTELDEWMSEFADQASENGWIPTTESRSTDDIDEDRRQRFFLTKEKIKELEKLNPDATFSTKSPFTLLTDEEFNAYVGNAYRKGDDDRRLRGFYWDDEDQQPSAPASRPSTTKSSTGATPNTNSRLNAYDFDFSDFSKWFTWRPTYAPSTAPSTKAPTAAPITSAPSTEAPTSAPESSSSSDEDTGNDADVPVTSAPASTPAPVTSAPTSTPAPVPTTAAPIRTRAPAPVTTKPAVNRPTTGPVAPVDSNSGPASSAVPIANGGDSFDWSSSPCNAPPQNQGQCGSCWAFATVGAVESAQCIAGGQKSFVKYSEQQLTACDTQNLGCNGGAPTYAYRYMQQNGLCTLASYPYASSGGQSPGCQNSCAKVQTGLKGSTRISGEAGLVKAVQTRPVVVAVAAGNNAWKQYAGGVLSSCQTSQLDHAVIAVGYDATTIKIKNSWGTRWGEAGYIRLKRTGAGQGTCSVYSDMSSPNF